MRERVFLQGSHVAREAGAGLMGDETKEVRKCCHGTPTTDYCHPCEKIALARAEAADIVAEYRRSKGELAE
jgi:hypothetical protein